MTTLIECACGCGTKISPKGKNGKPRKYLKGHQTKNRKFVDKSDPVYWEKRLAKFLKQGRLCASGSGELLKVPPQWIERAIQKKGVSFYWPKFNEGSIPQVSCACGCGNLTDGFSQKGEPRICVPEHGGKLADLSTRMVDWEKRLKEVNEKAPLCACGCGEKIYRTLEQVQYYSKIPKYISGHSSRKACVNEMTSFERSVIYGTLLGDNSIGVPTTGSARISFTHGSTQKEYAYHKREVLKRFACTLKEGVSKGYKKGSLSYRGCTSSMPILDGVFDNVTVDGVKRVNERWLSFIDDVALAYWFMDDGSVQRCKRGRSKGEAYNSALHTEGFSYDENLLLKNLLLQNFGVESHIKKSRVYFYLYMDRSNTQTLLRLIEPHLHKSMRYKGLIWHD